MSKFLSFYSFVFLVGILCSFSSGLSLSRKDTATADNLYPKNRGVKENQVATNVEDADTWFRQAQGNLEAKLKAARIERKALNVIMFLGDGMSMSTVTASRIYKGQKDPSIAFGEEAELHMDTFPNTGTSKTYCSDWQVGESACTATAYLCGTKGNARTIGVKPSVLYQNCTAQMLPENQVSSILAWAQAAGMSTGIVTTTTITEASPAGTYAHTANRDWEDDAEVRKSGVDPETCDDVAEQLILRKPGVGINVILGGGRQHFAPIDKKDVESGELGKRLDGKDLTAFWLLEKQVFNQSAKYLTSAQELRAINLTGVDYLMGLFAPGHLAYADKQVQDDDPTLAEMTDAALKILKRNPAGFFLFVEGGKIDIAHHGNHAKRAIEETLQFDDAIKLADDATADEDTLIVVTSDHSHLLTIAGDPPRGNPILGLSGNTDNADSLPHTTLAYINGPGYRAPVLDNGTCSRANVSSDDVENIEYRQPSLVPRSSATHGGEDVLIFAKGPFAHLLIGVNEQNFIPHAMAYAACISPFANNYCARSFSKM